MLPVFEEPALLVYKHTVECRAGHGPVITPPSPSRGCSADSRGDPLDILKGRILTPVEGGGQRLCLSNKFPGSADAAGP